MRRRGHEVLEPVEDEARVAADTLGRVSRGRTAKVLTHRFDGAAVSRHPDQLIVEEPIEIHLDGVLVSTTMRTPGHDFELAAGFCFTEGLLAGAPVSGVRYCADGPAIDSEFNVVTVETGVGALLLDDRLPARSATTMGLFVSGRASIEMVQKAWAGGFRALVAVS